MEARGPQEGRTEKAIWAGRVAMFLMQCIFAMFAEDVGLLPQKGFQRLIEMYRGKAARFHVAARDFFHLMDASGHSAAIQEDIRKFNGGLFHDKPVVEITEDELELLSKAAGRDWRNVEPAIFGTLLEQALDPKERAELGAHYTPRSYVERLVVPTIIEPLRADWEAAETEAIGLWLEGKQAAAQEVVRAFHQKLCATRVLDPACGTGNFLYVSLKLMKELEGDVLNVLADLGDTQYALQYDRHTVSPEQFYGLEKNARAVAIAELVIWIGYLQWHFATFGRAMPTEPILKDTGTIRHQDALLVYDKEELLRDEHGRPITRQDPDAVKLHPITGEAIPDPDAKLPVYRYVNPRPAAWPEAEFIVGNPPFIGKGAELRNAVGDGYAEALWASRGHSFKSADFVMFWWDKAAELLTRRGTSLRRFGFITTNSLVQKFSRRVLERHMFSEKPVRIAFAIPDHPWVKGAKKANVRIAMTVAEAGAPNGTGRLLNVIAESGLKTDTPTILLEENLGVIGADLTIGADVTRSKPLRANEHLSWNGVMLAAKGFRLSAHEIAQAGESTHSSPLVRRFLHGSDLTERFHGEYVIDTYGMTEDEVRRDHPQIYQQLISRVLPQRKVARDRTFHERWWLFGRNRPALRAAVAGVTRYLGTTETAKYRLFSFISSGTLPDHMIVAIALDDAFFLGVLSARFHQLWSLAAGGTLEDRPRYNSSLIFHNFPFPDAAEAQKAVIRHLAEELDVLRKDVIAKRDFLTMTKLYNVREKLVTGEPLTDNEKIIYEEGRVGVIHELHNRIDAAVADAYGWPADLSDQEILARLVALNKERAAEEAQGLVRWLRPEYQIGRVAVKAGAEQIEADLERPIVLPSLPKAPDDLAAELLVALRAEGRPVQPDAIANRFSDARGKRARDRIEQTLRVLSVAGSVQKTEQGWFAPRRAS